ncbi:T9SS type A sorting domain-containing protein [Parabacteroides sp. PF5-9]|uniref:T9SS type A sorting domain-containing protein n=1 Tax=Parabacteroides sp. PF5-9 TaxID=1742404 RepID=UPI002473DE51|nr:T9SS type A sorting domain-containing protein [Parabacteroides sp. PF5-9]MDH6357826.1 hypothetical protein [Parabacteroides sp. PF5-9]
MKRFTFLCILLCLSTHLIAQVSHGGRPLPLTLTRSVDPRLFCEMPAFDVEAELRLDALFDSDLRSGYRFAYKFITDYNRSNSGISYTLADGTKVWRLGIRSQGALSLNVLFTEYELPEGARLFVYNSDQTQILGAFNHLNNSELHLLPVAPIEGEELIIEYQEPPRVAFPGRLTVGEVNHGYRSLRGQEPQGDKSSFSCMLPLACYTDEFDYLEDVGRSVVLLIIDGSISCTGVMVNNTSGDGKPYLLTASHCLNNNFTVTNPDYEKIAGNIVCFFNYESPLCQSVLRGTEEMSVASSLFRAVNEQNDLALLELLETPPPYYRPYYSGWNASDNGKAPYTGIHHPGGAVKRLNILDGSISLTSFETLGTNFYEDAHWWVRKWAAGSTAGGSSGSPLVDDNGQVVGILSGGMSVCSKPENDFYYALNKAWDAETDADRQLKYWLDPSNKDKRTNKGLDPYSDSPAQRFSNVRSAGKTEMVETTLLPNEEAPLFGNNALGTSEYAEAYQATGNAQLFGTYIVNPAAGSNYKDLEVEITVYSGENGPQTLLHTELFQPSFFNKVNGKDQFQETGKSLNRAQESFIAFSSPVAVSGKYYVGYRILSAPEENGYFAAYNIPADETTHNTAWIKYNNQWIEATQHPAKPMKTSLFIDPVLQYKSADSNVEISENQPVLVFVGAERQTLHIVFQKEITSAQLSLSDINGKRLRTMTIDQPQSTIPVAYPSGIYLVHIVSDQLNYSQKVVF